MEQASATLTQLLQRMQQQSAMAFTSDPKAASRELERRKAECYNREEGTLNQQDNYNCPLCGIIWRHCRPYPGCSPAPGNGTRPIRAKIENAPPQGAQKSRRWASGKSGRAAPLRQSSPKGNSSSRCFGAPPPREDCEIISLRSSGQSRRRSSCRWHPCKRSCRP